MKGNYFIFFYRVWNHRHENKINARNRKRKSHLNLSKGLERINKFSTLSTSHNSNQATDATSLTSKHSHKINTNSSHKSHIPPTLPYTRQYKYKVKKALPKKIDESCVVIASLVREKLKNEASRKWLQFEIPELQNSQERTIHKEIALASKYGA